MRTLIPWPTERRAVPIAAVVFPFPGPVLTMMRPRRTSVMFSGRLILLEGPTRGGRNRKMRADWLQSRSASRPDSRHAHDQEFSYFHADRSLRLSRAHADGTSPDLAARMI